MTEPWFNPNHWAWLPGTLLGCSVGLWGTFAGYLATRGSARRTILGLGLLLGALAALSLTAGLLALGVGQPFGVWYSLVLPGAVVVLQTGVFVPLVRRRYRAAEERRMRAEDFN